LLDWLRSLTEGNNISVTTFNDPILLNGNALLAILNYFDSYECPFRPSDSARDNLERFFEDAARLYSFPRMLDADPDAMRDELALMVYLTELMDALPTLIADGRVGGSDTVLASIEWDQDDAVRERGSLDLLQCFIISILLSLFLEFIHYICVIISCGETPSFLLLLFSSHQLEKRACQCIIF
jgi:hypothetical protein